MDQKPPKNDKEACTELSAVKRNLVSSFRATGISPFDRNRVLNKLPPESPSPEIETGVRDSLTEFLREQRFRNESQPPRKRTRLQIEPGKSISTLNETSCPTNQEVDVVEVQHTSERNDNLVQTESISMQIPLSVISEPSTSYRTGYEDTNDNLTDCESDNENIAPNYTRNTSTDLAQNPAIGQFILAKFGSQKGKKTYHYEVPKDLSIIEISDIITYLPKPKYINECYSFPNDVMIKELRKRTSRVTSGQLEILLSKLEASPHLYTRKFSGLQGKEIFEKGWREVADELNQLPNGYVKTPEQWITVWRDFKSRACTKAAKLRRERMRTGNQGITTAPLTEVEKKIVSLIGVEYTFGSDCPDSMPEEETLQHEVEAGVEMVEVVCLSQGNEYQLLETERNKASPEPQIIASGSRATPVASPAPNQQQVQEITLQSAAPQITERGSRAAAVITTPPTVRQERPRRIRNLNPRRSTAEQANIAREDFLAVAKSNADSMGRLPTFRPRLPECRRRQQNLIILAMPFSPNLESITRSNDTKIRFRVNASIEYHLPRPNCESLLDIKNEQYPFSVSLWKINLSDSSIQGILMWSELVSTTCTFGFWGSKSTNTLGTTVIPVQRPISTIDFSKYFSSPIDEIVEDPEIPWNQRYLCYYCQNDYPGKYERTLYKRVIISIYPDGSIRHPIGNWGHVTRNLYTDGKRNDTLWVEPITGNLYQDSQWTHYSMVASWLPMINGTGIDPLTGRVVSCDTANTPISLIEQAEEYYPKALYTRGSLSGILEDNVFYNAPATPQATEEGEFSNLTMVSKFLNSEADKCGAFATSEEKSGFRRTHRQATHSTREKDFKEKDIRRKREKVNVRKNDPTWKITRKKGTKTVEKQRRSSKITERIYIPLDNKLLEQAETLLLNRSQDNSFREDIKRLQQGKQLEGSSKLKRLDVVLEEGLLRLKGRIDAIRGVTRDYKRPIVLDSKDKTTQLIIEEFHCRFNHGNHATVMNEIRQCFWVLGLSSIGTLSRHMKEVHPTVNVAPKRLESIDESEENSNQNVQVATTSSTISVVTTTTSSGTRPTVTTANIISATKGKVAGTTVKDYIVVKKPLPLIRTQQLDEQLIKMIAKGYHAFRLVEEKEFRKFVDMLNPSYKLPTRKTLSESLLPKLYNRTI
ncbi:unnamed protein product [Parnassius apollo]|uniref:(apollo) hypothetical protein n=1 Tax=Parnassius apollo TaxID=110799 RepID=A0A8S3W3Q9_PARAO|nr:unnamed protein product [Parnassius apollo]